MYRVNCFVIRVCCLKCQSPDLHYVVLIARSCPEAGPKLDRRDGIWLVSVDYY